MASNDDLNTTVLSALDRFLAMQEEHLASLRNGCLSQVNQWLEERQLIVGHMRQALAEAQSSGVCPELRDKLLEKLGCILEHEKALSDIAKQQRSTLGEKLSSLRRGKKALSGYGKARESSPRFVSHKQ